MIYVGGANRLTAKDGGFATARTIVALANGEKVELTVKTADHETGKPKMIKIVCQQGVAPIINGTQETTMRIGCGSATIGLLADVMRSAWTSASSSTTTSPASSASISPARKSA